MIILRKIRIPFWVIITFLMTQSNAFANSNINGVVWFDQNSDGIIDGIEPKIQGVPVFLMTCTGQFITSTLSDVNGNYEFLDVANNNYKVFFNNASLPSNYKFTLLSPTTDNNVAENGFSLCHLAIDGDYTIHGGFTILGVVGDKVWNDLNGNGLQDTGENGISNVMVTLYDSDDILINQTSTNQNGNYSFQNLFPGLYYLHFDVSENFTAVNVNNSNASLNSNITNANGLNTTSLFYINPAANESNIDAGFYQCAHICGSAYLDSNFDDLFSTNENGINGLRVSLYKVTTIDTSLFSFATTGQKPGSPSDDGYYDFCVPPGEYYLHVEINNGQDLMAGLPFVGSDNTKYNYITHMFGLNTTNKFTVVSGDTLCNINNGFYCSSSIGNRVWEDTNYNGVQDTGEVGLSGVSVYLYNISNTQLASTTTDENGLFEFNNLGDGHYYIHCVVDPQLTFTWPFAGDSESDSNINGYFGPGTTSTIYLGNCDKINNIDIGVIQRSALPVDWKYIHVSKKDRNNIIEWTVASEVNVEKYLIYRSLDNGSSFDIIGTTNSVNQVNGAKYQYTDKDPNHNGQIFYKIANLDFDGKQSYSELVYIDNTRNISFEIIPNPALDRVYLSGLDVADGELVNVRLYDTKGILVKNFRNISQNLTLDISLLPAGAYYIEVDLGTQKLQKKSLLISK